MESKLLIAAVKKARPHLVAVLGTASIWLIASVVWLGNLKSRCLPIQWGIDGQPTRLAPTLIAASLSPLVGTSLIGVATVIKADPVLRTLIVILAIAIEVTNWSLISARR